MITQRFPRGRASAKTFEERFWQKVNKTTDCWIWVGQLNESGYGIIKCPWTKNPERASRASWRIHFGEIPPGMCVLHKCDFRACIRPDHLFLGTRSDNTQDMMMKGRYRSIGSKHKGSKLTEDQVKKIISRIFDGDTYPSIAADYGINKKTVCQIAHFESWRHIPRQVVRKYRYQGGAKNP